MAKTKSTKAPKTTAPVDATEAPIAVRIYESYRAKHEALLARAAAGERVGMGEWHMCHEDLVHAANGLGYDRFLTTERLLDIADRVRDCAGRYTVVSSH